MNFLTKTVGRSGALSREVARKTREIGFLGMIRHVAAKLTQELRAGGPADTSRSDAFDSLYGTDTAKIVGVWALDVSKDQREHANRYETVAPEVFSDSLRKLQIPHDEFVFIDLGSGKGRALLLASRFPFKEIIGVELSASLNAVANRNLQIFKDDAQRCDKIKAICQNALDYQFPDENLVLYLYNPFDEHVMKFVVAKAEEFIRRSSKRVYVLYHRPLHRNVWDQSSALAVVNNQDRFVVYASKH